VEEIAYREHAQRWVLLAPYDSKGAVGDRIRVLVPEMPVTASAQAAVVDYLGVDFPSAGRNPA
jgi:hypothetical protein